jgi:molybdenum cofactor cytidylyltransferase
MGENKLLIEIKGAPLIRKVVLAVQNSAAQPVVVVTGHDEKLVRVALADVKALFVRNPDYREGLSTSLRAGIHAVGDYEGAVIVLGDMPAISSSLIDRMIAAFDPQNGRCICVAVHNSRRGNPVLFARSFFDELQSVTGDIGARQVLARHTELVREVEAGDDGPLIDIDTPDALAAFLERQ